MTEMKPKDPTAALSLPEGFHGLDGAKKVNAILSLDDAEGFVQSLAADEFYLLVHDIGLNDATDLLQLSTVSQRVACLDIDVWQKDELASDELDEWLDVLNETGRQVAIDTVAALDPELVVSYLMSRIIAVVDRTDEDTLHAYERDHAVLQTPDMDFSLILAPDDPEDMGRLRRMLTWLYEIDIASARSMLFNVMTGLRGEQNELAYQFRSGRLADLGFPPPDEAWALYARISLAALEQKLAHEAPVRPSDDALRLHLAAATVRSQPTFLNAALGRIEDRDPALVDAFLRDFATCVNRAAMASPDGLRLNDSEHLRELSTVVHRTVSLGLERMAKGDVTRAEWVVERAQALELFQVGHATASERARRAKDLRPRGGSLFGPELHALFTALGHHPNPLLVAAAGTLPSSFGSLADCAAVDARLDEAERTVTAFETVFGFDRVRFEGHVFAGMTDDDKRFVTFDTLAATLVAHAVISGEPRLDPLDAAAVRGLRERLARLDGVVTSLAARLPPEAEPVLRRGQAALIEGIGGIVGPIEPRYLTGVLLVTGD